MTQDSRGITLLPRPQRIKLTGKLSRIPGTLFTNLEPTRKQLSQLPVAVSLEKLQNPSRQQGYNLEIDDSVVRIEAANQLGWHYGLLTLKQLAQQSGSGLPQCSIEDWPDFENRGMMLDVSRTKVPKLETLFYLIDLFADWKINQLQLYIEHAFAYRGHEEVWKDASPLTQTDIQKIDTYCQERFIELVPNLNCFGHMHRWLVHDRYRPLAESPQGGETDYGYRKDPQGLCPTDPGSISLARDLINQMIACFKSTQVNVGCDETIDLGYGRTRALVQRAGRGSVYLDYLKKIRTLCDETGHTMQFWSDFLLRYPELVTEIPKGSIALNWGYEGSHPFETENKVLGDSGTPFYVCPGTSSWNSIGGRTSNMLENVRSAAINGKRNGAIGFMQTDWGDNGHWQPLLASFPGFVFGAANAWNQETEEGLDVALDQFVFRSHGWGKLLLQIGDLDQPMGLSIHNQSILFKFLQEDRSTIALREDIEIDKIQTVLRNAEAIKAMKTTLSKNSPIQDIMILEFDWVIEMLIHACRRGLHIMNNRPAGYLKENALTLGAEYKAIWHTRNRPGGFKESRAFFDEMIKD